MSRLARAGLRPRGLWETKMSEPGRPISEAELHAYVDNQLGAVARMRVDRYLARHADDAQRVATYRQQRAALRAIFVQSGSSPQPPSLPLNRPLEEIGRRRTRWQLAAALVLGVSLGGLGGWFLHGAGTADRLGRAMARLKSEALSTHAVYSVDSRHAVEVSGSEQEHLAQWLSKRLNRTITPPDLSMVGYELMGGRLLATESGGAAAMLMYEDSSDRRLSIVLRPMSQDMYAPRFDISQGRTNGCGWIEKGLGYVVVAALPDDVLDRIADRIKAELTKSTG